MNIYHGQTLLMEWEQEKCGFWARYCHSTDLRIIIIIDSLTHNNEYYIQIYPDFHKLKEVYNIYYKNKYYSSIDEAKNTIDDLLINFEKYQKLINFKL